MKTLEEVKSEYLEAAKGKPLRAFVVRDCTGAVCANSDSPFPFAYPDPDDLAWAKAHGHETYLDVGIEWVTAWPRESEQYLSAKGGYYAYDDLPEQSDSVVTELWSNAMKSERNSRLDDCDAYAETTDRTVRREAGGKRTPLTEDERAQVMAYRQALRDLPEQDGFPFIDFPEIPACIVYEVSEKAAQREKMKEGM